MDWLADGRLFASFALSDHVAEVASLMARYANVPMSLADACLVRMAEIYPNSRILTLDSDFRIYRKNGREPLGAVLPEVGS